MPVHPPKQGHPRAAVILGDPLDVTSEERWRAEAKIRATLHEIGWREADPSDLDVLFSIRVTTHGAPKLEDTAIPPPKFGFTLGVGHDLRGRPLNAIATTEVDRDGRHRRSTAHRGWGDATEQLVEFVIRDVSGLDPEDFR